MAVGKLAARVYKYNKRGIDVHFLNQQSRASVSLKVSEVLPGQTTPIRTDVELLLPQTKSKTRKLLEETTLYYGQPIGARLCDLFDQYVRESCNEGTGGRKRDILIISDGMPCKPVRSASVPCSSHAFSGRPRERPGKYSREARRTGVAQIAGI